MKDELLRQKRIHNLSEEVTNEELKFLSESKPIQKIIGFINFDNLQINVNKNVLIPRYETQEVVNESLKYISADTKVLDLCCGSGYIGLTIKQKINCDVTLSDISDEAIKQTYENALLNNLNVKILKSNLFENIDDKFDVIVSNPPYIPVGTILSISVINYEPSIALFGGKDGNDFYRKIINYAPNYLNKNGYLIFEISPYNFKFFKNQKDFKILKDINKKERIAIKQFVDL